MKRRRAIEIAAVVVVVAFTFYSALSLPVYVTQGKNYPQQGDFGASAQIDNRTITMDAFNSEITLGFQSFGVFVPYFKAPANSSLHGAYYVNLTSYVGYLVFAYGLNIVKENESLGAPWTGMTFMVDNPSITTNDSFLYIPLQVNYPGSSGGHPDYTQSYASLESNSYAMQNNFPVNRTLQFWVNFTLVPVAELGPYHFSGSSQHITITWNLTFVTKSP